VGGAEGDFFIVPMSPTDESVSSDCAEGGGFTKPICIVDRRAVAVRLS
jgi:hypothetical protein